MSSKKLIKNPSLTKTSNLIQFYPPNPFHYPQERPVKQAPPFRVPSQNNLKPPPIVKQNNPKKNEPSFFQKIIMAEQAPKTYQHYYNAKSKKIEYQDYSHRDYNKQAQIIQSGWKKYKRQQLINNIQRQEAVINTFKELQTSRSQMLDNKLLTKPGSKFDELVIERLLLDLSISNQIITSLQSEIRQQKESNQIQQQQVKGILEEYVQFIDSLIEQKQEYEMQTQMLQQEINRLKHQQQQQTQQQLQLQQQQQQQNMVSKEKEQFRNKDDQLVRLSQHVEHMLTNMEQNLSLSINDNFSKLNKKLGKLELLDQSTFDMSGINNYQIIEKELSDIQRDFQNSYKKLSEEIQPLE